MRWFTLILLVGCAGKDDDSGDPPVDPLSWAVDEPGPYQAGYRTWDHTYEPVAGESRTVRLNLWYPTEDTSGADADYGYGPDDEAFLDASLAPSAHAGGYPVLVHSHGDQAWGGSAAFLFRYLASHGWVVAAPDHTDNLLLGNVDPTPQGHWYHRPKDVSAMIDALDDLDAHDPLAGAAATKSVVLTGHSRGCYTAWTMAGATFSAEAPEDLCPGCSQAQLDLFDGQLAEPRVVAAIPLASGLRTSFGDAGHNTVGIPMLAMTGTEDQVGQQEMFDTIDGVDLTWLDLEGGCHETFNIGVCSTLDPQVGFEIVQTWVLAFARGHLLDDSSVDAILDGSEPVSDVVRYANKGP